MLAKVAEVFIGALGMRKIMPVNAIKKCTATMESQERITIFSLKNRTDFVPSAKSLKQR